MLNLSPALYEAKIEFENYKAKYFVKKAYKDTDFLYYVLANPEAENAEELENEYERLFDVYDQIAMRDAKANGVPAIEVILYLNEVYTMLLEDHTPEEIDADMLANAR